MFKQMLINGIKSQLHNISIEYFEENVILGRLVPYKYRRCVDGGEENGRIHTFYTIGLAEAEYVTDSEVGEPELIIEWRKLGYSWIHQGIEIDINDFSVILDARLV